MRLSLVGHSHLVLAVAVASGRTTSHLDGLSTVMSRTGVVRWLFGERTTGAASAFLTKLNFAPDYQSGFIIHPLGVSMLLKVGHLGLCCVPARPHSSSQ